MVTEVAPQDERWMRVLDLLTQAEAAHEQYQSVILKHPDPRWAAWLAGFVLDRGLQKLLPEAVSEEQLGRIFAELGNEYADSETDISRAEFFARRLLGTANPATRQPAEQPIESDEPVQPRP